MCPSEAHCSAQMNCILLCHLSLHEEVTFSCYKRIFSSKRPVSVTLQTKRYTFSSASLEVRPSLCCHSCPVFASALFCLSLPLLFYSLIFSRHLPNCYRVKMIWHAFNGTGNIFLSVCVYIPPHLSRLADTKPKCVHNSARKCVSWNET